MKYVRNLLIDCRIELRKLIRNFNDSELCQRIDAAVHQIDQQLSQVPSPAPRGEKTATSTQVALAWQAATRDLKFSDPTLYDTLKNKVMARLETKTLVDQATELRQLEDTVAALIAQQDAAEQKLQSLVADREVLLQALATAIPPMDNNGDGMALAIAKIEWLKAKMPETQTAPCAAVQADSPMPTEEVLRAVATGRYAFSAAQREWCLGEAMVLSNFEMPLVELLTLGDGEIAKIVLAPKQG